MKYVVVWWPSIGLLFFRNMLAASVLGQPGAFADWIFGRACSWSAGLTCGAGIIVSGAFLISAICFVCILIGAAVRTTRSIVS